MESALFLELGVKVALSPGSSDIMIFIENHESGKDEHINS